MNTLPASFHAGLHTWLTILHKNQSKFIFFSKYCQMFLIFSPIRILGRLLLAFVDVFCDKKFDVPPHEKKDLQTVIAFQSFLWVPLSRDCPKCWQELMSCPQELMFPPHAKPSKSFWVPLSWDYPHCLQELMFWQKFYVSTTCKSPPLDNILLANLSPIHPIPKMTLINYSFSCPQQLPESSHPSTSGPCLFLPAGKIEIVPNHPLLASSCSKAPAMVCTLVEAVHFHFYSAGVPALPNGFR